MSYNFQPTSCIYNFSSSSSMTLERMSPSSLSSSPTSTQLSLPSAHPTLTKIAKIFSRFTSPPSGAAVPLAPPDLHRARAWASSVSLGKRRGYSYTIVFEPRKSIGQATVAKGDLEPRAGALPRRARKKCVFAPPKVVESKGSDHFVGSVPPSDDSDNDE
ncbi:hypothetical protein Moror_15295 [Moniliophthora roreri MCA 2997]|uniref:Uncharacterized protein n=2 Tax=Moniliophthora roreri TaxID=221103 RepID=V2X1Z2_MONRO|nr:hypothetical protein Moror_15295 [Moniliophthora roreri MCA 2997]